LRQRRWAYPIPEAPGWWFQIGRWADLGYVATVRRLKHGNGFTKTDGWASHSTTPISFVFHRPPPSPYQKTSDRRPEKPKPRIFDFRNPKDQKESLNSKPDGR
jgi:hypothetical protein